MVDRMQTKNTPEDDDEIVNPQSLSPQRRDEFNKNHMMEERKDEIDNPEMLERRQRRMSEMSDNQLVSVINKS